MKTSLPTAMAAVALAFLTACSKPASQAEYAAAAPTVSRSAKGAETAAADASQTEAQARPAASSPLLAYSYRAGIEAPAGRVAELMAGHQKACAAAGATACQVLGAETSALRGKERAVLTLRARPDWLAGFRGRLEADAKAAGGRLVSSGVETEDLTRSIIDTDAALKAKITLRDRLQALLASRPGKLSDLLEVERELARVQGEIDAAQSELAHMRGRVATSQMTLTYESSGRAVSGAATKPLGDALTGAFGVFIWGLAAIVIAVAFAAPFLLIGAPIVWWWRKRRSARRRVAAGS